MNAEKFNFHLVRFAYNFFSFAATTVKEFFGNMRTRYGRIMRNQKSGSAATKLTARQSWIKRNMGFLKDHIVATSGRVSRVCIVQGTLYKNKKLCGVHCVIKLSLYIFISQK